MSDLIVGMSGKKQSGKSSACKFMLKEYLNKKEEYDRFCIKKNKKEVVLYDNLTNKIIECDSPSEDVDLISKLYGVKIYSFADPLKDFCISVFGLDQVQCYGTDKDKNTHTHISWLDMPTEIREKWEGILNVNKKRKKLSGQMTSRQIMQVFGTDVCRALDPNCWARALYNKIRKDGHKLSLIAGARFPNEVTMGTESGAKLIRLSRQLNQVDEHSSEKALDDFPLGEFSVYIDNSNMSLEETHTSINKHFKIWLKNAKI